MSLFLLMCGFAAAPGAPIPEGAKPVFYYPTKVGAKWVYQEGREEYVFVVTKVEDVKGAIAVEDARVVDGRLVRHARVLVSGRGLATARAWEDEVSPPAWSLKLPPGPDQKWGIKEDPSWASRVESVTVPAGTFDAVRVEYTVYVGGRVSYTTRGYSWYAPNVGLIKSESDGVTHRVLKSFTPGKE